MAGKAMRELQEEFLYCSICKNRFHDPKMLSCMHSFCQDCLVERVENLEGDDNMTCPTCDKMCDLPQSGVKGLPTNDQWVKLEEKLTNLERLTISSEKSVLCESCESPDVTSYCFDCDYNICLKCRKQHTRFPVLRSHSIVPIEIVNHRSLQKLDSVDVMVCAKHPSEKLTFFCKTCSELICQDCTTALHPIQRHDYTDDVTDLTEVWKEHLSELLNKSHEQLQTIQNYITEGKAGKDKVARASHSLQQAITDRHGVLLAAIQHEMKIQMDSLCEEASKSETTKAAHIEECISQASDYVKKMEETQERTKKVLDGDGLGLLALSNDLLSAFQSLRIDVAKFHWEIPDLQHDKCFIPEDSPTVNLGRCSEGASVVLSDSQGNFITCEYDDSVGILYLKRIRKDNNYDLARADVMPPFTWSKSFPYAAQCCAAIDGWDCVYVAIGRWLMKFDFNTKLHPVSEELFQGENSYVASIDFSTFSGQEIMYFIQINGSEQSLKSRSMYSAVKQEYWCNDPVNQIISLGQHIVFSFKKVEIVSQWQIGSNQFHPILVRTPDTLQNAKKITVMKGNYKQQHGPVTHLVNAQMPQQYRYAHYQEALRPTQAFVGGPLHTPSNVQGYNAGPLPNQAPPGYANQQMYQNQPGYQARLIHPLPGQGVPNRPNVGTVGPVNFPAVVAPGVSFSLYFLWQGEKRSTGSYGVAVSEYNSQNKQTVRLWNINERTPQPIACIREDNSELLRVCDRFGLVTSYMPNPN